MNNCIVPHLSLGRFAVLFPILCLCFGQILAGTIAPITAVSRKTHGSAGTFDLPLSLTGTASVECRSDVAGNYQLLITFAQPITISSATVTTGIGNVASANVNSSEAIVNLTGVADEQRIAVTLADVTDGTNTNDVRVAMNVLVGDVNGDGIVNVGDTIQVRNQSGNTLNNNNYRTDINADGLINVGDVVPVRTRSGNATPCSAPVVSIVSGQDQTGSPDSFLDQPLIVQVTCEKGDKLQNVPVTFSSDHGSFAASFSGQTSATLTLDTDQDGFVSAYFLAPNDVGVSSRITTTAQFNNATDSVSFKATTLAPNKLASGIYSASLVIQPDGTLFTWGIVPGDGKTPRDWPEPLSFLPGAGAVSAGYEHVLLLDKDGLVWSWGGNSNGQLGDGTTDDDVEPALVSNLGNVVSIEAGGFHSLALKQDGTVVAWGAGYDGQLGNNSFDQSLVPVAVSNLINVTRIAAGYERSLALKSDGTVWTWGFNLQNFDTEHDDLVPVQVPGLVNITAIAAGRGHAVAVENNGTVWAWGDNSIGQLGNASNTFSATPVQVSNITNAINISSSYDHTLAILSDGTVMAWGANSFGQLGNGTTDASSVPIHVNGLRDVVAVIAAESYSMALQSDGTLWAWGQLSFQSGVGIGGNALIPERVTLGMLDQNGNGMDDRWELLYFHNLGQTASGDFNGNGISNLDEWLMGKDPSVWDPANDGTVRPPVPENPSLTLANDESRVLTWDLHNNQGNRFIIERKLGPNGDWLEINRTAVNATTFTDSTAFSSLNYLLYRIRSLDNAGRISLPTSNLSVPRPAAPAKLSLAKNSDETITLNWVNRASNRTGTIIESRNNAGVWTQVGHAGANETNFTGPLEPRDTYRVRTTGQANLVSPPSNQVPPLPARYGIIDLGTGLGVKVVGNNGMVLVVTNDLLIAGYRWNQGTFEPLNTNGGHAYDMNNNGIVVGSSYVGPYSVGAIWRVGSSSPQLLPSPLTFGDTNYSYAYILAVNDSGTMYGGILDDPEFGDGYSASALGWASKIGTLQLIEPPIKTFGYALEPFKMNNAGGFIASRIDYNNSYDPVTITINHQDVFFNPHAINDEGMVIAEGDPSGPAADDGYSIILWNGTENVIDTGAYLGGMSSGLLPQITGNAYGEQRLWEMNNETGYYESTSLNDIIPPDTGWNFDLPFATPTMSRNGLIGGGGMYQPVDANGQPVGIAHYESFLMIPCELAVDANRDGIIRFAGTYNDTSTSEFPIDTTTSDQPYRFWINDDDDTEDGADSGETVPPLHQDWTLHQIVSKRNLEDFSRLWIYIGGLQDAITSGKIQVGLQWKSVIMGTHPAINIYPSEDGAGSDSYLKSDSAAQAQINDSVFNNAIVDKNGKPTVDSTSTFIFKSDYWTGLTDDNPKKCLLFEGAAEGTGELAIIFLDPNGNQIGEGGTIWLDIKNIKKMYVRGYAQAGNSTLPYTYTDNVQGPNITLGNDPNAAQSFQSGWDETPQCTVFVHGFNMTYHGSTNYAETMFKRLWWRGYKGRFATLRWPTFGDGGNLGAIGTYNDSEYMAWNSGSALQQFVSSLPGNYDINLVAHSLGNAVVGEALRDGLSVQRYAMLHAATSASLYSNGIFGYQVTNTGVQTADSDPDPGTRTLSYTNWLGAISTPIINFYDPLDSVIVSKWDANNSAFKPQRFNGSVPSPYVGTNGYFYDPSAVAGHRLGISFLSSVGRFVTDGAEAKAYSDFSLTGTIGGANKQANQSVGGSVVEGVNDSFFGDDHSNEWEWTIQQLKPFYDSLLLRFGLPRNP